MSGNMKIDQVNSFAYHGGIISIDGGCCENKTNELCFIKHIVLQIIIYILTVLNRTLCLTKLFSRIEDKLTHKISNKLSNALL